MSRHKRKLTRKQQRKAMTAQQQLQEHNAEVKRRDAARRRQLRPRLYEEIQPRDVIYSREALQYRESKLGKLGPASPVRHIVKDGKPTC